MITKNTEKGYFSEIDTLHMHIDTANEFGQLQERIDNKLVADQRQYKQIIIKQSLRGPQTEIQEFKETYKAHNPISAEDASFTYFVSVGLTSSANVSDTEKKQEAINYVASWMSIIIPEEKTTLEVERVVAKIDYQGIYTDICNGQLGSFSQTSFDDFADVIEQRTMISNEHSKPCEIHHYLDFDKKNNDQAPLELNTLLDLCDKNGITVGGWFVFDSDSEWLYRSNLFAERSNVIDIAKRQDQLLRAAISNTFKNVRIKTVVEDILGIWKFNSHE